MCSFPALESLHACEVYRNYRPLVFHLLLVIVESFYLRIKDVASDNGTM